MSFSLPFRKPTAAALLATALAVAACTSPAAPPDATPADVANDTAPEVAGVPKLKAATGDPNLATAATGWYRGDLHFHTNHSEDAKKQNGDDMKDALAIADANRDPQFVAAYPELAGNGLDYVAVTDHRTDACLKDPDFKHPHLILLAGEEYGGSGHAGIWGFKKHISHDPQKGESANQRHQDAIAEAHAQGALFSINHPTQDNGWVWDVKGYDGIEIWNGPWSAFYGPWTPEQLQEVVTQRGVENPYIRNAVARAQGGGANAEALRFWQNHLSAGVAVAPVGGGDRHMLVPPGLPTTYVRAPDAFAGKQGKALGPEGILAGIQQRATFISRSAFGAQVVLEAEDAAGKRHPMGSLLQPGATYTIHVQVGRAQGGLLRLYGAPLGKAPDGQWPDPQVLYASPIEAQRVAGTWLWTVPPTGAWLHAVVLEVLVPSPLPDQATEIQAILSKLPNGKALGDMLKVFVAMVNPSHVADASTCDPKAWQPWQGACMPADTATWATFYLPDGIVRLLSTWFEDGQPTGWCTGAISAAFLARP